MNNTIFNFFSIVSWIGDIPKIVYKTFLLVLPTIEAYIIFLFLSMTIYECGHDLFSISENTNERIFDMNFSDSYLKPCLTRHITSTVITSCTTTYPSYYSGWINVFIYWKYQLGSKNAIVLSAHWERYSENIQLYTTKYYTSSLVHRNFFLHFLKNFK